jgi:hypothetical protein
MLAPHLVAMENRDLNEISCSSASTDGSNHGSLKQFLVMVQYFHKVHGNTFILIDLNSTSNEKSETTANYITRTLKDHGLLTKSIAFSGDNTNINFGGINRSGNKNIFHALKYKLKKELVGFGCPAHILQHGPDTLSVDIECIVMKISSLTVKSLIL